MLARQQEKLATVQPQATADIAIVGMDCRLPGHSDDPERFWNLLESGRDGVSDDTAARWDPATYLGGPREPQKSYSLSAGVVDGVDQFDPQFFGISPREAETMDPQQRLALETSWRALEHAGIAADTLSGSGTGVFMGVGDNEYMQHCYAAGSDDNSGHVASSNALNVIAGRIAYSLGLRGPSLVVDTACSSSLVAVHLACQSLRNGESELAIAGGVNVLVSADTFVSLSKANMLSPSGRCRTFSGDADGYVRAEGCGAVVLKRLADAERDGDRILAVIRGSAVNQDGRSSSLTAPNGPAQEEVIRAALDSAGVTPQDIQLVETHGTGTALGDPIEVQALDRIYGRHHSAEHPLYLGALKSNIGHAESAAGIAALIKVVLCLQHRKIPPNLHCGDWNDKIDADRSRLALPAEITDWPESDRATAAISAFGFSGTNAHMIVAAPESQQRETQAGEPHALPIVVSARSREALQSLLQGYCQLLGQREVSVATFARTLARGRNHYPHRAAFHAGSCAELREQMAASLAGDGEPTADNGDGPLAFLFTGQGSQYAGMGEALYRDNRVFSAALDHCAVAMEAHLDRPLTSLLWGEDSGQLDDTRYTQPALFALEYSLARLWLSLGIEPDYVMGHSVGEYAAACIAGVFSLEDAATLICARGRLMAALDEPGKMLAVLAPRAEVEPLLRAGERLSVAAFNGPDSLVISGAADAIDRLAGELEAHNVMCQPLNVSHAFHSPLMEPMLAEFRAVAEGLEYRAPHYALISNVTGREERERVQSAEYWVEHVAAPVNFLGGMEHLAAAGVGAYLEVGPSATLLGMGRRCIQGESSLWLPSLRQGQCWEPLSQALAGLYRSGRDLDWRALFPTGGPAPLALPGHPLQKQRFWLEGGARASLPAPTAGHPLRGLHLPVPDSDGHLYMANWQPHTPAYLDHHRLYGQVVVPAASHVAMMLLAATDTCGHSDFELRDLLFPEAIAMADGELAMMQLYVQKCEDGYRLQLRRLLEEGSAQTLHAEGRLDTAAATPSSEAQPRWFEYPSNHERHISGDEFYREFWDQGYTLGSAFCWIDEGWQRGRTVVARMRVPALPDGADDYGLYPGLIDSCFQLIACCASGDNTHLNRGRIYIPFTVERFRYLSPGSNNRDLWCAATLRESPDPDSQRVLGDITLFTGDGQIVAEIVGFQARVTDERGLFRMLRAGAPAQPLLTPEWQPLVTADDYRWPDADRPWLVIGAASLRDDFAAIDHEYIDPQHLGADPEKLDSQWRELLQAVTSTPTGVLYQPDTDAGLEREVARLASLVRVLQARSLPGGLVCLTRGGAIDLGMPVQPAASALPALLRVARSEGSTLQCRAIDLATEFDTSAALCEALGRALASGAEELALTADGPHAMVLHSRPVPAPAAREIRGNYAITGGLGGLGLAAAEYLAERGATGLYLLGRSEPGEAVQRFAEHCARRRIAVHAVRCDIADAAAVDAWAAALRADGVQLNGLLHAAGTVRDQPLDALDKDSVAAVLAAKVQGTDNLLRALADQPLEQLVGFSSMSALLGTQGQAAYAVANSYLNAALGNHPAGKSLLWGPWADIGMASRLDPAVQRYYRERGITAFDRDSGLDALDRALALPQQVQGLIQVDWARYLETEPPRQLFAELQSRLQPEDSDADDWRQLPPQERADYLRRETLATVARALGCQAGALDDPQRELTALGVDSLIAVDLRSKLQKRFGADIAIADMMGGMTLAQLQESALKSQGALSQAEETVPLVQSESERFQPFPITDMQQAYWIGRTGVFDLGGMSLHGYKEIESEQLDLARFETAWQRLVSRHDMLRACILPSGEQVVAASVEPYRIRVNDLRQLDPQAREEALLATREEMSHQVLPLETWPAFDLRASLLDGNRVRLHLSVDGTFLDFRSFLILFRELILLYREPQQPLPELTLTFRDYLLTQRAQEGTAAYRRSLEYWQQRIRDIAPAPELPLVKKPSQVKNHRSKRWESGLSVADWSRFKETMQTHGLTQAATLLAVYGEVLATWSSSPRFCINVPVFNRQDWHPDVNHVLGNFSSFTLVEFDYSRTQSFVERVRDVQRQLMEGLQHHHISGVQILRMINQTRGRISAGAYPCVYTSLPSGVDEWDSSLKSMIGSELGEVKYTISQTPQVWIDVHVWYESGGLEFNWDAVEELFPEGMIDRMFSAYCQMIGRLAESPEDWQSAHCNLVPAAQQALMAEANDTAAPVGDWLLQEGFYRAAARHPHEPAVIAGGTTLSYEQLRCRANALAAELRRRGLGPNQLVAVAMPKCAEQVLAVMAILIAGGAYLPVDIRQPRSRIDYLLENGECQLLLDCADTGLDWPDTIEVLTVDATAEAPAGDDLAPLQKQADLAYVLYTSGSTGKPKGVMISHRNVVNMVEHTNGHFDVGPGDRAFNITALNHDLSVYDLFGCLSAGAAIVMPDEDKRREPGHWLALLQAHSVTLWNSVPALMDMLLESVEGDTARAALPTLRAVILGGDWVSPALPQRIHAIAPGADCLSIGGPTETTVWNIWNFMNDATPDWSGVPYGKPIRNSRYFVLGEGGKPCPVWVPGELCCAGECVSPGYWRDRENTERSFAPHPQTGEPIYRTGDLGRYLPDGRIEFVGRKDFQMKIRGQRIEAGEIEHALQEFDGVDNAVVVDAGEGLQKHLVAHVSHSGAGDFAQANKTADFLSEEEQQGVITNAVERLQFTLSEHGRRRLDGERHSLDSGGDERDYLRRQSFRRYDGRATAAALQALLGGLSLTRLEGQVLPKYRYPSAGGLYPVQAYLFIKPDAVDGLAGGYYYLDPDAGALVQLAPPTGAESDLYAGYLNPLYQAAAFSVFLVADLDAIAPMYGEVARDFCLLEAGYMGQLLMGSAVDHLLGLCPVGGLQESDEFRRALQLGDSHQVLHSFTGGAITEAQTHYWLEKPDNDAQETDLPLEEQLLQYLAGRLPEHMVPTRVVLYQSLPLTDNGKVDRKQLRENSGKAVTKALEEHYVAPETPTEKRFAEVLADILELPRINVEGNFFEMGANSIHMVKIQKRFKEELGRELAVTDLFRFPTLRSLVTHLEKEDGGKVDVSANRDRAAKRAAARGRRRRPQTTGEEV
nr:non-ribosomal peptide synthetase/type I polyketide synthase [Microbulbifer sp. GX H0434]